MTAPKLSVARSWLPVVGWEGVYEVSEDGQIKRVKGGPGRVIGRVLAQKLDKDGYRALALIDEGVVKHVRVHRIVCEAFNGPAPEGKPLVLHNDGDNKNNHFTNLRWGDASDNQRDAVKHGAHREAKKTECKRGHPLSGDNVYLGQPGKRACVTCRRKSTRAHDERRKRNDSA